MKSQRRKKFFLHPQPRLRSCLTMLLPPHPVIQRAYFSITFFSECKPFNHVGSQFLPPLPATLTALLTWLLNPLAIKAAHSQEQEQFVYLSILSFLFVLLASGIFFFYFLIEPSMHSTVTYYIFILRFQLCFRRRISP